MKKLLSVILAGVMALSVPAGSFAAVHMQDMEYTETLDELHNPGIGFYRPIAISLKESGNTPADRNADLVHLRFDIAAFSSNALVDGDNNIYGKTAPVSEDALAAAGATLENIKKRGHMAVVRFCYDKGYNGKKDQEPDMENLLEHTRQIAKLYSEHADTIAYIELGMFGPWGEMHSSQCCTDENVAAVLDTMLKNTPDSLCVGVRRPRFIAEWMGIKGSEFDVDNAAFKAAAEEKGKYMYRVGIFNDGYLGDAYDLGTYDNGITRDMCVRFLEKYGRNTPYGGEAIGGSTVTPQNSVVFVAEEAFRTHTAYLNWEWNYNLTQTAWANEIYYGDGIYDGQTAQKYIKDHMGYRFVLKSSTLPYAAEKGAALVSRVGLENTGFGNVTFDQKLTYILKDKNGDIYELTPQNAADPRTFAQGKTEVVSELKLTEAAAAGECKLYMRLSCCGDVKTDKNYRCIRFANPVGQWDEETGANLIGSFKLTEKGAAAALLKNVAGIWDKARLERYGDDFDFNNDGKTDVRDVVAAM